MPKLVLALTLVSGDQPKHWTCSTVDWRRVVVVLGIITLSFPTLALPLFPSLDSSWMIGLHEAVKRGFVFGRDVGFTYGPLGYILFPLNEGTAPTVSSLLLLALYATWWISVALIVSRLQSYGKVLVFMVGTLGFGIAGQREFLCTPSIILLATSGFLVLAQVRQRPRWALPSAILTAVGLLSKFNIGIACLGSFLAYLVLGPCRVTLRQAALQGVMLIVLLAVMLVVLFRAINGPLLILPDYVMTYWWMASGYSSQMTLTADSAYESLVLILAWGVAVFLLIPLLDRSTRGCYASLLSILALPLFLTYKSAIVRSDNSHMNAGIATFLALLCLLLPAEMGNQGRVLFRLLIPALTLGFTITSCSDTRDSFGPLSMFLVDGPRHVADLFGWERVQTSLRTAFDAFREHEALPASDLSYIRGASVDVYPWDISLVVANRLQWSPRYVLQSYQAFHPTLDAMGMSTITAHMLLDLSYIDINPSTISILASSIHGPGLRSTAGMMSETSSPSSVTFYSLNAAWAHDSMNRH